MTSRRSSLRAGRVKAGRKIQQNREKRAAGATADAVAGAAGPADIGVDMPGESCVTKEPKGLGFFEKYLTVWVLVCIGIGILLGNYAPELAHYLDGLSIYIGDAPVISIPIAVCLVFYDVPHHGKDRFC